MRRLRIGAIAFVALLGVAGCRGPAPEAQAAAPVAPAIDEEAAACVALLELPNLTVTMAKVVEAKGSVPRYCYVRGAIPPGIAYHVQLPLPAGWNGRFLMWGDGGKDGDLDFADERLAQGYAVANTNMGHDAGAEPGGSFAFDNRQAEIDFGYRAVHTTTTAAKTLVAAYYKKPAAHSYFEGCSTGGREALMEAQRYPNDFDGISAGAAVKNYEALNAGHTWLLQRVFRDNYAGNLAFDVDHDGTPESLTKLKLLHDAVLAKCDARDGITDGVIDNPLACDFVPARDLTAKMCANDVDADDCLTKRQLKTIEDFYRGPYDSKGTSIIKGRAFGSEDGWTDYVPYAGNRMFPDNLFNARDHAAFLFYEKDPGVPVPRANDLSYKPNKTVNPPEWAWWEFNIDDVTAGRADFMKALLDATDPDLTRFLVDHNGKLVLWHGWADVGVPPEATTDYYQQVVGRTFGGRLDAARERARLFMFPGLGHCGGGPGPNEWDPLTPLVSWVEQGMAPDSVVARHLTAGRVTNERRVCAHPQAARYAGPAGSQQDSANWVAANFTCE